MLLLTALQVIALQGATVHSQLPGERPRVATVLIEEGLIRAVAVGIDLPEGTRVVDLSGRHLLPGLIDGMVHHDLEHDALYTLAGVTLARDMGNELGRIFSARDPRVRDALPGPELLVCGAVLDGVPPATTEAVVVTSAEEVDDKLPRLRQLGADFFCFHLGIPAEAWRAAVARSHAEGVELWGPAPRGIAFAELIASGQDGLLGLDAFLPTGADWRSAEEAELVRRVSAFADSGMALTPLLAVYAAQLESGEEVAGLELLAPHYERLWLHERALRRARWDEAGRAAGEHALVLQQRLLRRLEAAGVRLLPGSGAPNPWRQPGSGLVDELLLWAEAGIPRERVLMAATRGAAEILGQADRRGAIAPGLQADLLCVEADPRAELAVLRRPCGVAVRGRWLGEEDLAALREALRAHQAEARQPEQAVVGLDPPDLPPGQLLASGVLEGIALGERVALESYAVVALEVGGTVYAARLRSPAPEGAPRAESHLVQRIERGVLQDFHLTIWRGPHALEIRGVRLGGQLRLERRIDGVHLETSAVAEKVVLVDLGSGSTAVVLGRERSAGALTALYFEDADPAIGRWELVIDEEGRYLVRSGATPWAARLGENGHPEQVERRKGTGVVLYRPLAGAERSGELGLAARAEKR
jgi:hypothetical protein